MKIKSFEIHNPLPIVVPNKKRQWMDDTHSAFAYRCLPLTVANGFGWSVLCPTKLIVLWNGGSNTSDLSIVGDTNKIAVSHFGSGILTFNLGFLIRTESSHNLYVKGPANLPKRGISPLEGIVETDWLPFTFTMNWKVTEQDHQIIFEKDEPICNFFPYPRNYIEQFNPESDLIANDEIEHLQYNEWLQSRIHYNNNLRSNGNKGERDYLRGQYKSGEKFEGHQNIIKAKDFTRTEKYDIIDNRPCFDNCCLENEQ
jgi:hypothetical protein